MTIVPLKKLQNDPQHLLYHNPSIHPVQYTKLSQEYHHWKNVALVEQTARMCGRLLVPAKCLHWERKARLADRRMQIGRYSFFLLEKAELTDVEYQKYITGIEPDERRMNDGGQAGTKKVIG